MGRDTLEEAPVFGDEVLIGQTVLEKLDRLAFEAPEQALANPKRFLAYVRTYGDDADMCVLRQYVSDDELCAAIDTAPRRSLSIRHRKLLKSRMVVTVGPIDPPIDGMADLP